jgi:hypothetical protein
LTDAALETGEEYVKLPVDLAAGAVLMLKGIVKRRSARPRDTYRKRRDKMLDRAFPESNPEYRMILWAREFKQALLADAKARNAPITPDHAGEIAAKKAKEKFGSSLAWETIRRRILRPSRYTRRARRANPPT